MKVDEYFYYCRSNSACLENRQINFAASSFLPCIFDFLKRLGKNLPLGLSSKIFYPSLFEGIFQLKCFGMPLNWKLSCFSLMKAVFPTPVNKFGVDLKDCQMGNDDCCVHYFELRGH